MADSIAPIKVGTSWVNINSLSGIAAGTRMFVQNIGSGVIIYAIKTTQPTTERAGQADELEQFEVTSGSSNLWAKCTTSNGKVAVQAV